MLQDADRIDALGAVGVARVFAYGGHLGRPLYDMLEPTKGGSLAHFYEKILKLPDLMNTETGRRLARGRASFVREFIRRMLDEIELRA